MRSFTLFAVLALLAAGCEQPGAKEGNGGAAKVADSGSANRAVASTAGRDEVVAKDQVPATVLKAAQAAVPGFELKRAEKEVEGGTTLYSLEGTANGKSCEIEVTTDGRVLEIEDEDDGDGDDDGEDDDEDGDDDED
jgi:hypothetical protein